MIPELTEQGFPPESIARMLVNELRAAPQLRGLVLRELLTEDFLELPQRVTRLEESVAELRDDFTAHADSMQSQMDVTRRDIAEMRSDITEIRGDITEIRGDIVEMRSDITEMRGDIIEMRGDIDDLKGQFGNLRGESYESKCSEDIELVLVDYIDRPLLADRNWIRNALVRARRDGTISRLQYDRARVVDIIADGEDLNGNQPILAVVEASVTINDHDVNAAHERAAILRNVTGRDTRPFCVANVQWSAELASFAENLGVTLILYELPHFGHTPPQ